MIFITESIVLCVLFTVLVLSKMNKPLEGMIYSYPPAIVDRVIELGLIEDTDRKTSSTQKALKRKWPARLYDRRSVLPNYRDDLKRRISV